MEYKVENTTANHTVSVGKALAPRVSRITNIQLQRCRATTSDPTKFKEIMEHFQISFDQAIIPV